MHTVEIVLLVIMVGAVSGITARYLPTVPLPLIQIGMGALLSWPEHGLHIAFDPELFLLLFIPPLLFADGWRIPKREFFRLYRPVLLLALGLVLITVLGVGYLIHWLIPAMPLSVAFALAAVISPTDAVAVSAITRNLGMPEQTQHVLEGESMLNDASGLVALKFAVAATLSGTFSWFEVSRAFVWMAVGGVAVGVLLGWGFGRIREKVSQRLGDSAATQMVLLLVLLPFAAYLVGEYLGVSGVLSAVAAGITTNFTDLSRADYVAERLQTGSTWLMVESTFNGAVFLLLGLQLPSIIGDTLKSAGHEWWVLVGYIAAISVGLLVVRWLWLTFAMRASMRKAHRKGVLEDRPTALLGLAETLAGIRGAITLAAALSIPVFLPDGQGFPARNLLIFLAAGVILFTLLVGSVGLPLVLSRLPPTPESPELMEERHARVAAFRAAIAGLAEEVRSSPAAQDTAAIGLLQEAAGHITTEYRNRIDMIEDREMRTEHADEDAAATVASRRQRYAMELELRLHCLRTERRALYEERRGEHINDESLRKLVRELDLTEISINNRLQTVRNAARASHDG